MGVQIQASVEASAAGAGSKMETKLIAIVLGVALVLATVTIVTTHQAFAVNKSHGPVCPPDCNGVRGDQHNNGKHLGQLANGGIVIRGN